jgi:HhH-GPD superfamily base excision DNA repair protein
LQCSACPTRTCLRGPAPLRRSPGAAVVNESPSPDRGRARPTIDRWVAGRALLLESDDLMAELVKAKPDLNPDLLFDGLPSDLWGALVLQVIGQQLSLAAAAAILARLEALQGGRMPTPAELLATDAETLRTIGMSRAKAAYLHDLAARLQDGRLDLDCPHRGQGRRPVHRRRSADARAAPARCLARRRPRAPSRGGADLATRPSRVDRADRHTRGTLSTVAHTSRRVPLLERRVMSGGAIDPDGR